MNLVEQGEQREYDKLFVSSNTHTFTRGVPMVSGNGVLKRGTILTKDANENYLMITANSQKAEGVLAEDIDTDIETVGVMYRQGHFNKEALIFGGSITKISELARTLREINILVSEVQE